MYRLLQRDLRRDWRLLTSPFRVLPDFIIPGETKCGTTSFYHCLTQHPDVYAADVKEPRNFIDHPQSYLFCRCHYPLVSTKIYHKTFRSKRFLTGEASAEYLSQFNVPKNISSLLPHVKLIVLMRNPVFRAYSDYQMFRNAGTVSESFDQIVTQNIAWLSDPRLKPLIHAASQVVHNPIRYVMKGLYARNIKHWLRFFPKDQFMFIKSEDFFRDPQRILDEVFDFLGLRGFRYERFPKKRVGQYNAPMAEETMQRLLEFYRPHNEELYELLDKDFEWEKETLQYLHVHAESPKE